MPGMWLRFFLSTQLLASHQGPGFEPHVGCMLWGSSLVAQMVKNLPAMQETQIPTLGQEDPLEKGMAIDFNILAWKILWREELQSMGFLQVGYD